MQKPLIPALLLLLSVFFGCSKTADTPDGNSGLWTVTYFLDTGDKTADTAIFTGYSFEFNDKDEMVIHLPGGTTQAGQWFVAADVNRFFMKMDASFAPVDAILGSWDIKEQTDTSIKLQYTPDTSTNTTDGKTLYFEKQ